MGKKAIPECHYEAAGLAKGYKKYFNFETTRGSVRMYLITLPLMYGIYRAFKWNKTRKVKNIQAIKDKEDREILTRAVNRWLANGRKFDY